MIYGTLVHAVYKGRCLLTCGLHAVVVADRPPPRLRPQDLRKVAAHKAKTVMLLHPAGDDAEVLKAASAMCLTAVGSDRSQGVVVQMQSQLAEAEDVLQSLSNTSAVAGACAGLDACMPVCP